MSMGRSTRRSGLVFLLIGILGGLFFWVTDPKYGPPVHNDKEAVGQVDWRHWLFVVRGSPENQVDAANQTMLYAGRLRGLRGAAGHRLLAHDPALPGRPMKPRMT